MFGKKGKKKPEESQSKADESKEKEQHCPSCGSSDTLPAGFGNMNQCQKCGTIIS